MEKETKHPDFNEWLKTPDGLSCNDISTLAEQKYLTNRLFWAFDAGRNCVWSQYLEMKKEREELVQMIELWVSETSSDIDNASGYKKLLLTNSKSLLNRIKK